MISSTPAEKPRRSRGGWVDGVLGIVAIVGAIGCFVVYGDDVRLGVLDLACEVTGCSAGGMVAAGWLVVALPALIMAITLVAWPRLPKTGRRIMIILAVPAFALVLFFIPGRRRDLDDMIKGTGADQFIEGLLWALGGLGATLVALFVMAFLARKVPAVEARYNTIAGVVAVLLVAAALPVAIANTGSTFVQAEKIFPPVLSMNGDTLTRTGMADQRGCDGVLPDDSLLNRENCVLTVRATYITDDSDAVATLRAVLYGSDEAADRVRDGLTSAKNPSVIEVYSTTFSWLLAGTAAHADGRAVTAEERPWVLWPLRQVSYHFIGVQGGIFIDPDPKDEIRPRTP